MRDAVVEKKRRSRHGSRGLTLIELLVIVAFIGILAAIAIPNLMTASRNCRPCIAAAEAKTAVIQAIKYAEVKGVYPTSITVLREEGYTGPWMDKDPWRNEWVLSPVLTRGGIPREGDNIYVFSRGAKGTGVYPQPFTSETGLDGSVGYSTVDGLWGPSYIHESPVADGLRRFVLSLILYFILFALPTILALKAHEYFHSKQMKLSLSKDYQSALKVALLLQIAIGLCAAIAIDGGLLFELWWRPMAAYYGCFIVMVFRRPKTPTKLDLFLVKWGFVLLIPCAAIINAFIWRWMGVIR